MKAILQKNKRNPFLKVAFVIPHKLGMEQNSISKGSFSTLGRMPNQSNGLSFQSIRKFSMNYNDDNSGRENNKDNVNNDADTPSPQNPQ